MDACVNRSGEVHAELQEDRDLAKGLRMIADARDDSLAAAKLYESLMQILEKYRDAGDTGEKYGSSVGGQSAVESLQDLPPDRFGEQQHSSHVNDAIQLDLVDWDDLFSSVSSSPFF